MNRNVLIVLAGGFLIAVLVALLVQTSLSGGKKAPEPVVLNEEPTVQILVAKKDLKVGTELDDENMKWQDWPKKAVFPGAIEREEDKKPSETLDGRLRRALSQGEPIVESALVPETEGNFMAASLAEGKRAVSVNVSPAGMVAGFVGPGDYVDVLLTYKGTVKFPSMKSPDVEETIAGNIKNMATETILQNMKVLAVDQSAGGGEDDEGGAKVGKVVTLEVSFQDAETLAIASQMGTIHLALRRLGDDKIIRRPDFVTTDARVTQIYRDVLRQIVGTNSGAGENNAGKASRFVRIYRGEAVEDLSVGP